MESDADVLIDLAEALHGVQLPADEVESLLTRVAERAGMKSYFLLLQSYVGLDLQERGERHTRLRRIPFDAHWRLARMRSRLAHCALCTVTPRPSVTYPTMGCGRSGAQQRASVIGRSPTPSISTGDSLRAARARGARTGGSGAAPTMRSAACCSCVTVSSPSPSS